MQTTIEREMDFFYDIVTDTGERFILHLEFESGINLEIVYRVGEYHGMSLRRYKLPIRHLVVYLGEEPPIMRTELNPNEVYTGFDLLNVHALDTNELLSSQIPEVVLIAILSNYPKENAEIVLHEIVINLKDLVKHKRTLKKYINQLTMLSRLRKIEELTIKISEEMPIHYEIETDALYIRGGEKQAERKDYLFVLTLLNDTDHDDAKIARLVDVSLDFVQKVKEEKLNFETVKTLWLDQGLDNKKIARLANVPIEFVKKVKFIWGHKK